MPPLTAHNRGGYEAPPATSNEQLPVFTESQIRVDLVSLFLSHTGTLLAALLRQACAAKSLTKIRSNFTSSGKQFLNRKLFVSGPPILYPHTRLSMTEETETFAFSADINQLLSLIINTFYYDTTNADLINDQQQPRLRFQITLHRAFVLL
jgi:hypothetical protein